MGQCSKLLFKLFNQALHLIVCLNTVKIAGGCEIQADCDAFIKSSTPLSTTDSFVSKPGCLPCKGIIHVLAPSFSNGQQGQQFQDYLLYRTVCKLLELADSHGFTSVSLPAIGSGRFDFSSTKVTETMLQGVLAFSRLPRVKLREIRIIDEAANVALQFVFAAQSIFKTPGSSSFLHVISC